MHLLVEGTEANTGVWGMDVDNGFDVDLTGSDIEVVYVGAPPGVDIPAYGIQLGQDAYLDLNGGSVQMGWEGAGVAGIQSSQGIVRAKGAHLEVEGTGTGHALWVGDEAQISFAGGFIRSMGTSTAAPLIRVDNAAGSTGWLRVSGSVLEAVQGSDNVTPTPLLHIEDLAGGTQVLVGNSIRGTIAIPDAGNLALINNQLWNGVATDNDPAVNCRGNYLFDGVPLETPAASGNTGSSTNTAASYEGGTNSNFFGEVGC